MVRLNVNYMSNKTIADFLKPTILTAKHYDRTISVEINHSDIDIDEVMDVVETLIIGMGFSRDSFRQWIKDAAEVYNGEDSELEWPEPNEELKNAFQNYVANLPTEAGFDDYGQRINKKK